MATLTITTLHKRDRYSANFCPNDQSVRQLYERTRKCNVQKMCNCTIAIKEIKLVPFLMLPPE